MSLAQDVGSVRDYINKHGWCKGQYEDERTGAVCLEGAINHLADPNRRAVLCALELGVSEYLPVCCSETDYPYYIDDTGAHHAVVPYYNDHLLASKQDALDFLDKVRIKLEEKA